MPSEAVDIDVGQLVGRRQKECPVVVDLHELSPVGGWPAGGRDGRRFEWFAEVDQDLPDRTRLGDECDEPDVATTTRGQLQILLAVTPAARHSCCRRKACQPLVPVIEVASGRPSTAEA